MLNLTIGKDLSVMLSRSKFATRFWESGWYRVTSGAGEEMPTECIHGGFRCGTAHPIWMNDTFPEAHQIKNVTACAADYNTDCCISSYDIQVKNCSGYYVYKLVPTTSCPQAYCFGTELPCPEGESSPTGFTPGCKYDPCLKINHNELDDWRRSVGNNNTLTSLCDSFLDTGWYRPISKAGQNMPTVCPVNGFTCGTTHPIWMNGTFPESGESHNVTACSVGLTNDCCVHQYDIQVKNCSKFLVYNLKPTKNCPESYCFVYLEYGSSRLFNFVLV
ncbi:uromodulin-like [Mytilus trossulus]|uniref:uromodulin-like n=1 Tax=Mytilus trossulus TaxID=6551 RepID=UPI003007DE92